MKLLEKFADLYKARFVVRTNRFVAQVEFDGKIVTVHVPSTGRMQELLYDGTTVYLEKSNNPKRKTLYGLRLCEYNGILIDLYAAKANNHFRRIIETNCLHDGIFSAQNLKIKPEWTHGRHKFDFYLENDKRKVVIEVKSVNLVVDDVAMFPDAPTSRGASHLESLGFLVNSGYECQVIFLVMREDAQSFQFNTEKDPLFHSSAIKAMNHGVNFRCLQIKVTKDAVFYQAELPIVW